MTGFAATCFDAGFFSVGVREGSLATTDGARGSVVAPRVRLICSGLDVVSTRRSAVLCHQGPSTMIWTGTETSTNGQIRLMCAFTKTGSPRGCVLKKYLRGGRAAGISRVARRNTRYAWTQAGLRARRSFRFGRFPCDYTEVHAEVMACLPLRGQRRNPLQERTELPVSFQHTGTPESGHNLRFARPAVKKNHPARVGFQEGRGVCYAAT